MRASQTNINEGSKRETNNNKNSDQKKSCANQTYISKHTYIIAGSPNPFKCYWVTATGAGRRQGMVRSPPIALVFWGLRFNFFRIMGHVLLVKYGVSTFGFYPDPSSSELPTGSSGYWQ